MKQVGDKLRVASKLTSAAGPTSPAHIPACLHPPGPLLIPDSAAPAAAAKPPSTSASAPRLPCRKTDALLSLTGSAPSSTPSPAAASSPRGACWGGGGAGPPAALRPRQAQSPPDKPLNGDLPGGATSAFLAKTPVWRCDPGLSLWRGTEPQEEGGVLVERNPGKKAASRYLFCGPFRSFEGRRFTRDFEEKPDRLAFFSYSLLSRDGPIKKKKN